MKKNRFLTFLFSCLPGAGHMYLGYMKRGLQYMLMFAAAICLTALVGSLHLGMLLCIPVTGLIVVWPYAMFDSMHMLTKMRRDCVEFPDDDRFTLSFMITLSVSKKAQRAIGGSLIALGILILLVSTIFPLLHDTMNEAVSTFVYRVEQYMWPILLALALVVVGIRLLSGPRKRKESKES